MLKLVTTKERNREIARGKLVNATFYLSDTYNIMKPIFHVTDPSYAARQAAEIIVALELIVKMGKEEHPEEEFRYATH